MPDRVYWIQLENRPWDVCPHNIDRMTGQAISERETGPNRDPVEVTLVSPGTGRRRNTTMYRPLKRNTDGTAADALILRRYMPPQHPNQDDAWTVPDDRKINPWDLNEPDPTENGTMGTIPGPVIECLIGESVIVHFRNMDHRSLAIEWRTHSLHPHGFVFGATSDGAFPLSPPDLSQPIEAEQAAWAALPMEIHVSRFKKGDRVPPGGTFTYTWNTRFWPSTSGVWLYHDHSICDETNVNLGAIGIIVIHNRSDPLDVIPRDLADGLPPNTPVADLPGGLQNGLPIEIICHPLPESSMTVGVSPGDLERLGSMGKMIEGVATMGMISKSQTPAEKAVQEKGIGPPILEQLVSRGDIMFEVDAGFTKIDRFCSWHYRLPPANAQYLQLFHSPGDAGMCINGRKYLGNTPTMIAGPHTQMRFGVVGMGDDFHTFHIHGHRWIIPGPDGSTADSIQVSPQNKAVSQFEDTRIFGPANSFVFNIKEDDGSFMGTFPGEAIGEWHMHCHVLNHMMMGMMGSLLIVADDPARAHAPASLPHVTHLPVGVPMPTMTGMVMPSSIPTITVRNNRFLTADLRDDLTVAAGSQVIFDFQQGEHTVMTTSAENADRIDINNGTGPTGAMPRGPVPVIITGRSGGTINFQCGIHGPSMHGTIHIS